MRNKTYASLHSHTDFSNIKFPDSINTVEDLIDYAHKIGLKGLAITDHECISSYVRVGEHIAKRKAENIDDQSWQDFKIIYGNEIYLCRNGLNKDNFVAGEDRYFHFILLAKDPIGNEQIRELSTRAWDRSYMYFFRRTPTYFSDLEDIIQKNQGHVIASSACFRKGTKVTTKEGVKPIEEITSNDMIINRYGEWEQVNYPTKRHYKGKGIKLNIVGNEKPIIATANHQFLIFSNKSKNLRWYTGEELRTKTGSGKSILVEPLEKINYSGNDIINKEEYYKTISKDINRRISLPEKIKITPEIMRLFGLYLGDGHTDIKNKRIGFTLNITEFDAYYNSFIKPAGDQLGIAWSVHKRPKNNRVDITSGSVDLVELFYYLFKNQKANTKEIPNRLLNISKELDFELMFGYMLADGYFRTRMDAGKTIGYESGEFAGASISKQLAYDFYNLLNSYGITTGIKSYAERTDKNNVFHQKSWYIRSANKTLGRINKLQEYKHEEVLSIFNQAIADKKARDMIELEGVLYRKRRIQSVEFFDMDEEVHCLNVDSHSFLCEGVIVHNCLGGQLPTLIMKAEQNKDNKEEYERYQRAIQAWTSKIQSIFGKENFYLELQPGLTDEQIYVNKELVKLSKELDVPCIITTDSHYLNEEGRDIHRAYLKSKEGDREVDAFYEATYVMTAAEMWKRMKNYMNEEDFLTALDNTIKIANQCEDYNILQPLHLPYIPRPETTEILQKPIKLSESEVPNFYLFYNSKEEANKQLAIRLHNFLTNPNTYGNYKDNFKVIDYELGIIWESGQAQNVNWSKYLLQMSDYIDIIWNEGDSIICPSRGSAGASYVMYALGIIQIDKTREKAPLLFERFMNPERASVVDVDIDVESTKRNRVIAAIQAVYGEEQVVRVCTFKTEKARSAIQAAGRGTGVDIDTTRYISSLVGSERGLQYTLSDMYYGNVEKGLNPNATFINEMEKYPDLWKVAQRIEGLINGIGIHAGGIIVLDEPLTTRCSIITTTKGIKVSSFDLHDAEKTGLIKIDLLATEGLSKIRTALDLLVEYNFVKAEETLRETYEKVIGVYNIERDDPEMWKMVWDNEIIALFQMEQQSGVQGIALTKPRSLEDLATLNSVMRLMAPERGMEQPLNKYARFREDSTAWDKEMISYGLTKSERDLLHSILDYSSGMCAHQEDLYQLLTHPKVIGWSLGKADKVRKSVAKKNPQEYNELEKEFFETVQKRRTCSPSMASYVWRVLIATQRGYSFKILKPYMVTYK